MSYEQSFIISSFPFVATKNPMYWAPDDTPTVVDTNGSNTGESAAAFATCDISELRQNLSDRR
jgi:hypothetical protein